MFRFQHALIALPLLWTLGCGEDLHDDVVDTGDTSDTNDTGDTSDTNDTGDTSDTDETGDTGDTSDTDETGDTGDTDETGDTGDTSDTDEAGDTDDTSDTDAAMAFSDLVDDWLASCYDNCATGGTCGIFDAGDCASGCDGFADDYNAEPSADSVAGRGCLNAHIVELDCAADLACSDYPTHVQGGATDCSSVRSARVSACESLSWHGWN